jgi:phasin family protein
MVKASAAATASKPLLPILPDIRKIIDQLKVPGLDIKQLIESSRKDVEALVAANERAYSAMDTLARRQAELLTKTINEWQAGTKDLLTGKAAAKTASQQVDQAQQALERALGNMRDIAEFVAKSHEDVTGILNRRFQENMEDFKARLKSPK